MNAARLQREILVTAHDFPTLTAAQIADLVGCSERRAEALLAEFDGSTARRRRIRELNAELGLDAPAVGFGYGLTPERQAARRDFGEVPTADAVRPASLLALSVGGGAVLLLAGGALPAPLTAARWGALTLCALGVVLVCGQFARTAWVGGAGRATDWLVGAGAAPTGASGSEAETEAETGVESAADATADVRPDSSVETVRAERVVDPTDD